jgi:hypothetical protein
MARLVSWPIGLRANGREPLSGPRTIGAAQTQSVGGFVQTVAAPFGLWRWRFSFPPIRGQLFRRYRGWVTSLHGGANATRVTWCDWDQLSFVQRGIVTTSDQWKAGVPWSNGLPWQGGEPWGIGNPVVAVSAAADKDATTIALDSAFWGNNLDIGDVLGFMPFHFGWYMVTERIDAGQYRIWPPLDKAISTDDFATLNPVMAARLESEEAATASRSAAFAEGLTVTLIQVKDYDVRDYFAD